MTKSIFFAIPGKPFAKQRPRSTRQGRVYTPQQTVAFEATVQAIALQYFPAPIDGPIKVTIEAVFEPPRSWSKKKTAQHLGGYHTQRPDLDNCQKAILDGLNRVAFADDSQVAEIVCAKRWGTGAHTTVKVESLQ